MYSKRWAWPSHLPRKVDVVSGKSHKRIIKVTSENAHLQNLLLPNHSLRTIINGSVYLPHEHHRHLPPQVHPLFCQPQFPVPGTGHLFLVWRTTNVGQNTPWCIFSLLGDRGEPWHNCTQNCEIPSGGSSWQQQDLVSVREKTDAAVWSTGPPGHDGGRSNVKRDF